MILKSPEEVFRKDYHREEDTAERKQSDANNNTNSNNYNNS